MSGDDEATKHGEREAVAAAGAADLLPGAGERAGEAGEDRGVEAADVDAELQRVRRDDTANTAVAEATFDRPTLVRQIAAAVALDFRRVADALLQRLAQVAEQQLDADAGGREDDGLHASLQQPGADGAGRVHAALTDAEFPVDDRRVIDGDHLPAARGAVVIDEGDGAADDVLGQLARVGDGGGAADEERVGAVEAADAAKTTHDVRDVAPEHAAVLVQLVDDDVAEILEQLHPLGVVRQDGGVEHVGIGDDDVARLPHLAASVTGRVAVVGEGANVGAEVADQLVQLLHLVLGEGLGGEEIEGARLRVIEDALDDGQVVAERLSGGGGGHDDDALPLHDGGQRLRLVRVEAIDAATGERLHETRVRGERKLGVAGGKLGQLAPFDEAAGQLGIGSQRLKRALQRHPSLRSRSEHPYEGGV